MAKKSTSVGSSKKTVKKEVKKSISAKKPVSKSNPVKNKKPVKAAAKSKSVKKTAPVKTIKKAPVKNTKAPGKTIVTKTSAKVTAVKNSVSKQKPLDKKSKAVVAVKSVVKADINSAKNKKEKNTPPLKAKEVVAPVAKGKTKTPPPAAKVKVDPDEKFHNKAQRIIKELEETMDMNKVKPRIKVPVYSSPRPKQVVQQKLSEPTNTKKEKYQLEFEFRSSKAILFNYLSDSSGMAGWFADEVRSSDDKFVFVWEGVEVHAKQITIKDLQLVRYQWTDETDGTYFQFEIKEDDITSDIALLVTDWANPGEKENSRMLWETQVQELRQLLGIH
ncbi:MAG: START-like domain-containing protein [Bacteroidota bacterium]